MIFKNCTYEDLLKNIEHKTIIQFGASSAWHYYRKTFPDIVEKVLKQTIFVVDNDVTKQGTNLVIAEKKLPIEPVDRLLDTDNFVILITVSLAYQKAICEQLLSMQLPENIECYSLPLMTYNLQETDNACVDEYFVTHTKRVNVPKIHSFWFSGEDKPELYKRCLDSWYRLCPDFEIIEWNAKTYDVTKNRYMKEAFENRKWAFVSDYARLDIIYEQGGIYLDMDVELRNPLTKLLQAESFFCRQEDGLLELGSGFGASAGNPFIKAMLDTYTDRSLILYDGSMDMTPQPEWLGGIMEKYGFGRCHDSQVIGDSLILSNDYITCPVGNNWKENAKLGIHWHNGGWLDEKSRKLIRDSFVAREMIIEDYFTN